MICPRKLSLPPKRRPPSRRLVRQVPTSPIELSDLSAVARTLFGWARKDSQLKVIPAVERELIINALAETGGNQVQAAKLLGITRATLRKRIDKFHIKQELSIH